MQFQSAALFLLSVVSAGAQAPTVEPNTPVRIDMMDRAVIRGIFTSQSADSAFVWSTSAGRNHGISWSSIDRVRVPIGRRGRSLGAGKGLKRGAVIGGVGGAVYMLSLAAGAALQGDRVGYVLPFTLGASLGGAVLGGLYGAAIGGLVGSQRWRTVYSSP